MKKNKLFYIKSVIITLFIFTFTVLLESSFNVQKGYISNVYDIPDDIFEDIYLVLQVDANSVTDIDIVNYYNTYYIK